MGFERYTSFDDVGDAWDSLADRIEASPFMRPGWIRAWWESFGSGTLEIAALEEDGELLAILPLARRAGGLHATVNWHTPEFGATAVDALSATRLYREVLRSRPAYASLRFVDEDDEVPLEALRAEGYRTTTRTLQESPYLPLGAGWDALAKPNEKEIARRMRRLGEAGEVTFDPQQTTAELARGFEIEGSGWKLEQGTAIVSRPDTLAFYTRVAEWAESRGSFRLFFLRCAGDPIAVELGLEERGRYYFLKGGYDPAWRAYAPGIVILREIVRWACDRGLESFEFLGGSEPQKLAWTQLVRTSLAIEAFAPGPRGAVAQAVFASRPAVHRLLASARRRRS